MLESKGHFATEHGSKYLQQLCKHFAHKIDVTYDETSGQCHFGDGDAAMTADEAGLTVRVSAKTDEHLTNAKFVVDKHLERFAFRENFTVMDWQDTPRPE